MQEPLWISNIPVAVVPPPRIKVPYPLQASRWPYHDHPPVETPLGPVHTLGEAILVGLVLMNREAAP